MIQNAENQITQMDQGAAVYGYDGDGRRMKKTVGSETTYYFYAMGVLVSEFTTENTGATAAASTDRTRYQTSDRLGTAVLIMEASGLVVENNRTMPYGEEWLPAVASANEQKFTSYQRDGESGLDYAGARYYGSRCGCFASPDQGPMVLYAPSTLNRYAYAVADPINHIDPSGNFIEKISPRAPEVIYVIPLPPVSIGGGFGDGFLTFVAEIAIQSAVSTAAQAAWDALSEDCQTGLIEGMTGEVTPTNTLLRVGAVNRGLAHQADFKRAVAGTNVDWRVLAAIGIRESHSGALPSEIGGGSGVGYFHIDLGQHPSVTRAQAEDFDFAASYVVGLLTADMARLGAAGVTGTAAHLAAYNHGSATVIYNSRQGLPLDTSRATNQNNNYGNNVAAIMNCFD